jgi:D-lyxose ketol-isomerase
MKRSHINTILQEGAAFIAQFGFVLPPFAFWSPQEFATQNHNLLVARGMGWDITDYGQGRFDEMGLFLFTTRNGPLADAQRGAGMVYAEKIMISRRNQLSPMHRHILKTEDIINRGGAKLVLQLFAAAPDGSIDRNAPVSVPVDGQMRTLAAGGHLALRPGESVTLMPSVWHAFWGDGGDVLIGEVSSVNDDHADNIFEQPIGRFAQVTEDTTPLHLLVSDYGRFL